MCALICGGWEGIGGVGNVEVFLQGVSSTVVVDCVGECVCVVVVGAVR